MADLTPLSVIAFPGAPNLPIFAAQQNHWFERAGIALRFETTPSSVYQFEQFGSGAIDIAFTAFDNVVAYSEGQGAVAFEQAPDFRAIWGATRIELSLVAQPDIRTVDQLRGKSLALDAVGTGFAFVLYGMLDAMGLKPGDYDIVPVGATPARWASVKDGTHAATMTIEPFTSIARAAGFNLLARSGEKYSGYQGGVIAVRDPWANANQALIGRFLGVYRRGLAWVLDPENRDAAAALLMVRMPEIQTRAIDAVLDSLISPATGLTADGAFSDAGMKQVLALRSRFGAGETDLDDTERYLDRRWLDHSATAA